MRAPKHQDAIYALATGGPAPQPTAEPRGLVIEHFDQWGSTERADGADVPFSWRAEAADPRFSWCAEAADPRFSWRAEAADPRFSSWSDAA